MGTSRKLIALSVAEGRTVRDLLYNGLLDRFREAGYRIAIFTEGVNVPSFVREFAGPDIEFHGLLPSEPSTARSRAFWIRRRIARLRRPKLLQAWLRWEWDRVYTPPATYLRTLQALRPAVYLATHAHETAEAELLSAARHLRIPTLGLVRSWDNVYKGIRCRPDRLAVWNEVNRQEVVELEGYDPDHVHVTGAPQFDPYFAPGTIRPRDEFAHAMGLDPKRPVILFATLGNFFPKLDETAWMDALLAVVDEGRLPGRPQILCRLHPWSRLEQFQRYADHPDVRLSYVTRYWPALGWYMTRSDVSEVANMLHHAAVVVTPGSTISLEAAIFDRPSVVPVFHPYQPERAREHFATWVLGKHYARIASLDLVPIVNRIDAFAPALLRSLQDPDWYRLQRARLVTDYVHFTDGRATERVAGLAVQLAEGRMGR